MIFQQQKFCLILFYNSCFHNSFQKCLLKMYGNQLISIQNFDFVLIFTKSCKTIVMNQIGKFQTSFLDKLAN